MYYKQTVREIRQIVITETIRTYSDEDDGFSPDDSCDNDLETKQINKPRLAIIEADEEA